MRTLWRQIAIAVLVLFCMAAGTVWLVIGTESGSGWLLKRLIKLSPATIELSAVEGRLADHLVLHDLEAEWGNDSFSVSKLELAWSPWELLYKRAKISRLTFDVIKIRTAESSPHPDSSNHLLWPQLPSWLDDWSINIAEISCNLVSVQAADKEESSVHEVKGALNLNQGRLQLTSFQARYLDYLAEGSFTLNLKEPATAGKVTVTSNANENIFDLSFDLKQDATEGLPGGPVSGRVIAFNQPEYRYHGELQLNRTALALSGIVITQAGHNGELTGQLALNWEEKPKIRAAATVDTWPALPGKNDLHLDGDITADGTPENLHGSFSLATTGREILSFNLAGEWQGQREKVLLMVNQGAWLDSSVTGQLQLDLQDQLKGRANLNLRGLNPARIDTRWSGLVNLDAGLDIHQDNNRPVVQFDAQFIDSLLHQLPLSGAASGTWQNDNLTIRQAELTGDGFALQAAGSLGERLDLAFNISALDKLVPRAAGQLSGQGWVGRRETAWIGALSADGEQLSYDKLWLERMSLTLSGASPGQPVNLSLRGSDARYGELVFDTLSGELSGLNDNFSASLAATYPAGEAKVSLSAKQEDTGWQGALESLRIEHDEYGDWTLRTPTVGRLNEQGVAVENFDIAGPNGRLYTSGKFSNEGSPENLSAHFVGIPLSLLSPLLDPVAMTGELDMTIECDTKSCQLLADGVESVRYHDQNVELSNASIDGKWDTVGLHLDIRLEPAVGGIINTSITSDSPLQRDIPLPLSWTTHWQAIPLSAYGGLPGQVRLSGTLQGDASGTLTDTSHFDLSAQASIEAARLLWRDEEDKELELIIDEALADLRWDKGQLHGEASVVMGERGHLSTSWQLPIPARLPVTPVSNGIVAGHLEGWLKEAGLAGVLWPDIIQDSGGNFNVDIVLSGQWNRPIVSGTAQLQNGRGYIPTTGIFLKETGFEVRFDEERINILSMSTSSEQGKLTGKGFLGLQAWRPETVNLELTGENFTLVNLPELQLRVNPHLQLSGKTTAPSLTGDIEIPYFLAIGREERNPIRVSPDVVIVDSEAPATDQESTFGLTTSVTITLGEYVLVKMFGLDARLEGKLELNGTDTQNFTGSGEIQVAEGSFSTYGVKLDIAKGRATYADGPLDNPAIDILAIRKVGDTQAGVQIRGLAKSPEVELYSVPSMPDTDILSLIVLGRPLDQAGGETDPLMLAAGALLSAGDSAVLRNRLQRQLGLDNISAETDIDQPNDTILRLGKYLTPDLYLDYGYSLFGQRSEVGLRYHIYEGWEAESTFGQESSADLFYRFEFD